MIKKGKKIVAVLLAVVLAASMLAGCGGNKAQPSGNAGNTAQSEGQKAAAKFKVAALLPGPINDGGWNASAYDGIKKAEKELGAEIAYRESVPQSDFEEAFRAYASQGYNVIIGHGFQFGDAAKKVAKEFPKTTFLITDSRVSQEPNVGSYSVLAKQAGFLGGALAALMTRSGKVACVGGLSIPPVTDTIEGFKKGVKYVNPKVEAMTAITGSFEDVAKAKETARAFIENGADIIMHNADQAGLGVIQSAQEKKILAIGVIKDQSGIAPDTVFVSAYRNIADGIVYMLKQVKDGQFKAQFYPLGVKQNVVGLYWNSQLQSKVPPEVKTKIEQIINDLKEGKIDIDSLPQ
ncbi:Purine-binding protein [Neomoorella glycerini]|uniref:Purine-binding protein n=2 Tax=Neomoorella glycerini TaxID=55779 RepID=A0A6I5ZSV1_9FIRM|nr:Purine-binding protein [Moorella glycerini]